jgi:hypothetical protein
MNFLNLLPQLAAAIPGMTQGANPAGPGGFAGPMNNANPMDGISSLYDPELMLGQQSDQGQAPQRRPPGTPSKFMNALGMIGDALSTWRGGQPLYQQNLREQQTRGAMENFLTDPEGAIQALMGVNPELGLQLYQQTRPKPQEPFTLGSGEVRYDPSGKEIARGGSKRETVEIDGVVFDKNTGEPLFESPYDKIVPGAEGSFYTQRRLGIGKRGGQGASQLPSISSQAEYDSLPPGAQYRDSQGNIGVKNGGATASPSGNFR